MSTPGEDKIFWQPKLKVLELEDGGGTYCVIHPGFGRVFNTLGS